MRIYPRKIPLSKLVSQKSHFLFGTRSTGKSTLITKTFPNACYIDLLSNELYERLLRESSVLGEMAKGSKSVIIDEIQRLPKLLNEVQRLMKNNTHSFLLTASNTRKLKTGSANLLGGRAWQTSLHPLSYCEIDDFDLHKYLNRGGLPHIYLSEHYEKELRNYISLYLQEEIIAEGVTRKLEYFISFLDVMALSNSEELHFQNLSHDSQVPAKTIQNYIQILEDTLLGFQHHAYRKTKKERRSVDLSFIFLISALRTHWQNEVK